MQNWLTGTAIKTLINGSLFYGRKYVIKRQYTKYS